MFFRDIIAYRWFLISMIRTCQMDRKYYNTNRLVGKLFRGNKANDKRNYWEHAAMWQYHTLCRNHHVGGYCCLRNGLGTCADVWMTMILLTRSSSFFHRISIEAASEAIALSRKYSDSLSSGIDGVFCLNRRFMFNFMLWNTESVGSRSIYVGLLCQCSTLADIQSRLVGKYILCPKEAMPRRQVYLVVLAETGIGWDI